MPIRSAFLVSLLVSLASAQPVIITAPTTLNPGATTITPTGGGSPVPLASADITVRGTTLTMNGRHAIRSLTIERSPGNEPGVLTHTAGFTFDYSGGSGTDFVRGFDLTVSENLSVQGAQSSFVASGIYADRRGHGGGTGPGAGGPSHHAPYGSRAEHAGHGAVGLGGFPGGGVYGSVTSPSDLGSGGGHGFSSGGGAGGGVLRLTVNGTLTVDGIISANGHHGGGSYSGGGGSGGSVQVACGSMTGSGSITTNGGNGGSEGGGGGGGRIAIFTCDIRVPNANIHSLGGSGYRSGQSGSIYFGSSATTITRQPVGGEYRGGDFFQLGLAATSTNGSLSYQWCRRNAQGEFNPIAENERGIFTEVNSDTLFIAGWDCRGAGVYDCLICDSCGCFPSRSLNNRSVPTGST